MVGWMDGGWMMDDGQIDWWVMVGRTMDGWVSGWVCGQMNEGKEGFACTLCHDHPLHKADTADSPEAGRLH